MDGRIIETQRIDIMKLDKSAQKDFTETCQNYVRKRKDRIV